MNTEDLDSGMGPIMTGVMLSIALVIFLWQAVAASWLAFVIFPVIGLWLGKAMVTRWETNDSDFIWAVFANILFYWVLYSTYFPAPPVT